jgi:hypothetical protein
LGREIGLPELAVILVILFFVASRVLLDGPRPTVEGTFGKTFFIALGVLLALFALMQLLL